MEYTDKKYCLNCSKFKEHKSGMICVECTVLEDEELARAKTLGLPILPLSLHASIKKIEEDKKKEG